MERKNELMLLGTTELEVKKSQLEKEKDALLEKKSWSECREELSVIQKRINAINQEIRIRDPRRKKVIMATSEERSKPFREIETRHFYEMLATVKLRGWYKKIEFEYGVGLPPKHFDTFIDFMTGPTPWGLSMRRSFAELLDKYIDEEIEYQNNK